MAYFVCYNIPKRVSLLEQEVDSRYKTRQLQIQIISNNTHFLNIGDVAKDMKTQPQFIIYYISLALSTRNVIKTDKGRISYSINGKFSCEELTVIMSQFINEVILCPICGLPELEYVMSDDTSKFIIMCRACSYTSNINYKNEKYVKLIIGLLNKH